MNSDWNMIPDPSRAFSYMPGLRPAFLGHMASRLDTVIGQQSRDLLAEAGAMTPARSVSVALYLLKHHEGTTADIARHDGRSHQLVASRVGPLEKRGLVAAKPDPEDERCRLWRLTAKGRQDAVIVEQVCRKIANSLRMLEDELEVDLLTAIERAEQSLLRMPLGER